MRHLQTLWASTQALKYIKTVGSINSIFTEVHLMIDQKHENSAYMAMEAT